MALFLQVAIEPQPSSRQIGFRGRAILVTAERFDHNLAEQ
jgi:hypothetical protein